jgi:segregation and condensation protein B
MSLKAEIEAIIYATETPVTVEQITALVKNSVLAEAVPEPDPEKVVSIDASPIEAAPMTDAAIRGRVRTIVEELTTEYAAGAHGIEIRSVAGGYRMATKPEHHDLMRGFAKSLKPPIRLSLAALETLAVIAYKQPVTVPEISEVRGVDAGGVITTLLDRKLITTAGRKQVIGRPILYKTTKEFLMRFGLNEVGELPSMEEFEKLVSESFQNEMFEAENPSAGTPNNDATPQEIEHDAATETVES